MILKPLCCGILPRRGAIQSRVSFASTVKAENMDDYSFTKKILQKKLLKGLEKYTHSNSKRELIHNISY